uniref:Uncharacterized protein n=1 Tax=Arundo donax TaxID=35708 RepID=A0A0A9H1I2_ARUDO
MDSLFVTYQSLENTLKESTFFVFVLYPHTHSIKCSLVGQTNDMHFGVHNVLFMKSFHLTGIHLSFVLYPQTSSIKCSLVRQTNDMHFGVDNILFMKSIHLASIHLSC